MLSVSDRIVALRLGAVAAQFTVADGISERDLVAAMLGVAAEPERSGGSNPIATVNHASQPGGTMRGRAQSTDQRARAGELAGQAAPAAPGPRPAAPAAGGRARQHPDGAQAAWAAVLAAIREVPASRMQMAASVAALVAVALIFQVQTSLFLSPRNVTELLLESIQVGVMALGLIFVLLLGEIDLSVASLSAVCATVTASAIVVHHMSTGVGITLGLAAGVAFGLVQGLIISVFGAPSLIVTLGGSLVLSGLLLVILPIVAADSPRLDHPGILFV